MCEDKTYKESVRKRVGAQILGLLFLVFCSIQAPALCRDPEVSCDVPTALNEIRNQGCLAKEQGAKLGGWLNKLTEQERNEALKSSAESYRCLLEKRVEADTYACFREVLRERLYAATQPERLCLQERLTRALIDLRQLAPSQGPSATKVPLDAALLDRSLNDFLEAYGACKTVQQNASLATSVKLAAQWCIDPKAPWPPVEYIREFIDTLVHIAAANPNQGRHIGAVLGAVLRNERSLKVDAQTASELNTAYKDLIEPDMESVAGTSHFYIFADELLKIIPRPDGAELKQIRTLLQASESLQNRLETGSRLLQNRAYAWKSFEKYSDLLFDLSVRISSTYSGRNDRAQLIRRSCEILRRGIEVSVSVDAQELIRLQEKLLDRVRSYGLELGRSRRWSDVIKFETGFLDGSPKVLLQSQQCFIHSHLAQAFYMLEDNRNAMEHLGLSCGISVDDLKKLKEQAGQ